MRMLMHCACYCLPAHELGISGEHNVKCLYLLIVYIYALSDVKINYQVNIMKLAYGTVLVP